LPAARLRYLPLSTARGVLGVLGVQGPATAERSPVPEQARLLEAFASQGALALERASLAEQARRAEMLQATEKLQTALLNSISHDLRTPLVSITGALSSLQEDGVMLDGQARRALVDNARAEAERLNRLVGNLLEMTRLEAGALKVRRQAVEVADLVGTALQQLGDRLEERPVTVAVPDDLPAVGADFVLMLQVLGNLLDNALKYSPAGSPLELSARGAIDADMVDIEVADRGTGIPPQDLERIFDKFYRVQRPGNATGTGLGLSICKGIVEAHGGRLQVENRPGGGTRVRVSLPAAKDGLG
jgi:two-component system sensor histidine kinase KdpD